MGEDKWTRDSRNPSPTLRPSLPPPSLRPLPWEGDFSADPFWPFFPLWLYLVAFVGCSCSVLALALRFFPCWRSSTWGPSDPWRIRRGRSLARFLWFLFILGSSCGRFLQFSLGFDCRGRWWCPIEWHPVRYGKSLCSFFCFRVPVYGYFARISWILGSLFLFVREIALGILENCGLINANSNGVDVR